MKLRNLRLKNQKEQTTNKKLS